MTELWSRYVLGGGALAFAAGANRAAVARRMLYDVSDTIQFGRRKPTLLAR